MDILPSDIRVGMAVIDSEGHHIGKVDDLKFPENATDPAVAVAEVDRGERRESIVDVVADAFGSDEVPEPLRSRLLTEGYLRLDADGLFAADRYILPGQIARATGDEIRLNVTRDALIKTR